MSRPAVPSARTPRVDETPARRGEGLLTARELAEYLRVTRSYVYRRADALGALRLPADGATRRAGEHGGERLRFDLDRTLALLTARGQSERSPADASSAPEPKPRRRRAPSSGPKRRLLPIHGGDDA
jgi:hypothetical protein